MDAFLLFISLSFLISYCILDGKKRETIGTWMINVFTFVQVVAALIGIAEMIFGCAKWIVKKIEKIEISKRG